jgi:uncharacterized protein (TIGR00725 family)
MNRPAIIGVMGGGSVSPDASDFAYRLGVALAREGWIVLNGGRNEGIMDAVSHGARDSGGLVVGILPDSNLERASSYLTIPIRTGLGDGRNVINILSSDVVVALPGGAGTISEIALSLKNHKPLFLLGWKTPPAIPGHERALILLSSIPDLLSMIKETLANIY